MSTIRRRVVDELAAAVPRSTYRCVLVGIDGVDGAGKTVLGDELVRALGARGRVAFAVHADDFLNLRQVRHRRGRRSPEGYWRDSYDLDSLRRLVLDPLRSARPRYCAAATDPRTDRRVPPVWRDVEVGSVAVLDGLFLHRDELVGSFDHTIYLRVPFATSVRRMAARDGTPADPADPTNRRYVDGQRLYVAAACPEDRATVVVDNSELDAPRVLRRP